MMSPKFARDLYLGQFSKVPGALEVLVRWEALLENQAFLSHVEFAKHFRQGLDPMPNRDRFVKLLRCAGHDFAMVEVVPEGSYLGMLSNAFPSFGGSTWPCAV